MEPLSQLKALFPTPLETMLSIYNRAESGGTSARDVMPSVLLGGALLDPAYAERAKVDEAALSGVGAYRSLGTAAGSAAGGGLEDIEAMYGRLSGGNRVRAEARSGQAVFVGNESVVYAGGVGKVQAGNGSMVRGGNVGNEITIGERSVATGGSGGDVIRGGDQSAVRGGGGDDDLYTGDSGMVTGDDGEDYIVAGTQSLVDGGDDNDMIEAGEGSEVDGGGGNDVISVHASTTYVADLEPSQVRGGAGRDAIRIYGAAADIGFGKGDGADILDGTLNRSTLVFEYARLSDVTIRKVAEGRGFHAVLEVRGTNDSVTIVNAHQDTKADLLISFRGGGSISLGAAVDEVAGEETVRLRDIV